MVRNDILSHNSILNPSGDIDCEACRLHKCQATAKSTSHGRFTTSLDTTHHTLSNIPSDILAPVRSTPTQPLDLVHCDGFQFDFPSGDKIHFFLFIDHFSDFRMVYPVSSRADFITCLQAYQAFSFYYLKTNIKVLRLDNAGEMSSDEVYSFARFNGIHLTRCTPYEHHQNGVAERGVRTVEESSLSLLYHARLSVFKFIKYAVVNAAQIRNKCITKKTMNLLKSPHEIFTGAKPRLEDIHPIGQICYSYIKKEQRHLKYDPKARTCIFLCEDFERRAYLVMDISNQSVILSRDVRFPKIGANGIFASSNSPFVSVQGDAASLTESNRNSLHGGSASGGPSSAPNRLTQADTSHSQRLNVQSTSGAETITIPELLSKLSEVPKPRYAVPHVTPVLESTVGHDVDVPDEIDIGHNSSPLFASGSDSPNSSLSELQIGSSSSSHFSDVENEIVDPSTNAHFDVDAHVLDVPIVRMDAAVSEMSDSHVPQDVVDVSQSSRRRKNSRYFNADFVNCVFILKEETPTSYKNAIKSRNAEKWNAAMKSELDSLHREGTWHVVPRSNDMFVIKCKWVFKIKTNEFGEVIRYKARLVAQGFTQTYGIDYDDTYAPVADASTRRLFLCLASDPKMVTKQIDIETAFLQSTLDKDIYLTPPLGLDVPEGSVLKLLKAIYGLKQSPLLWYLTAFEFFSTLGFLRCVSDPCLLYLRNSEGVVYLCIYVDDILISSLSVSLVQWVIDETKKRFPVRDERPLTWIVGLHVRSEEGALLVSQEAYITNLTNNFLKDKRKKRSTPMTTDLKKIDGIFFNFVGDDVLLEKVNKKLYQKIVGSLNYLSCASRPDITLSVNMLSRYLSCPRRVHLHSAYRVVEYLNSTLTLAIRYRSSSDNLLFGYADSSFPSLHSPHGKPTCGLCVFFNGNLVLWKSVKLNIVCLSTMEAELCALALLVTKIQFIQNVLAELGLFVDKYQVFTDSENAIKYLQSPALVAKPRTRHLALQFHFLRTLWMDDVLELTYVPTTHQIADIFTKPLGKRQFQDLREKLMG